jgi:hypothetical protein
LSTIPSGKGFWIKTKSGVTAINTATTNSSTVEVTTSEVVSNNNGYDLDDTVLTLSGGTTMIFTSDRYVIESGKDEDDGSLYTIIQSYTLTDDLLELRSLTENDTVTMHLPSTLSAGGTIDIDGDSEVATIVSFAKADVSEDPSSDFDYGVTGSALYDSIKCGSGNYIGYIDDTSNAVCLDTNNHNSLVYLDYSVRLNGEGAFTGDAVRFVNAVDGGDTIKYYVLDASGTSATWYEFRL